MGRYKYINMNRLKSRQKFRKIVLLNNYVYNNQYSEFLYRADCHQIVYTVTSEGVLLALFSTPMACSYMNFVLLTGTE